MLACSWNQRHCGYCTYLEDLGMRITMYDLLHRASQEGIVSLKTEALLVEVVQHVVRKHVLQDRGLPAHGGGDIFANRCKELDIDRVRISKTHLVRDVFVPFPDYSNS